MKKILFLLLLAPLSIWGQKIGAAFQGSNGTISGKFGAVPAPAATDNTKFLRGDGTWQTVTPASVAVSTLVVSPTSVTTSIGQVQAVTHTITPTNATNQGLTWVSSNTSIATVNSTGIVTAIANGSSIVTAQTVDGSNKIATVNITVTASPQVRLLNNASINNVATIIQADLQSAYNAQGGFNAPDVVPAEITAQANSLNSSGYKLYLGHNQWWYTNTTNGITSASWTIFGGGGKSNFGASVLVNHIMTFK